MKCCNQKMEEIYGIEVESFGTQCDWVLWCKKCGAYSIQYAHDDKPSDLIFPDVSKKGVTNPVCW